MSRTTSWISEIRDSIKLTPRHLGYYERKLRNDFHAAILKLFQDDAGMTRADLARKLDKRPEQITRWLSAPGNWTFDTAAALALAMGSRFEIRVVPLGDTPPSNQHHPLAGYIPGSRDPVAETQGNAPAQTGTISTAGARYTVDLDHSQPTTRSAETSRIWVVPA